VSFQKINNLLLFPGKLDDSVGNIFFGSGRNPVFFVSEFKDSGAILSDTILFYQSRIFIRIDEFVLNFWRMIGINFKQVFHCCPAWITFAEKGFNGNFLFQVFDYFNRLLRKTVNFSCRKIDPVVVSGQEIVNYDQQSQDQDDDEQQISGIDK